MPVTSVDKDHAALTMTLTADFGAEPKQVWDVWEDPRKLEQWWGPPMYPATFVEHDLSAGGRTLYYMTSPEGEKYYGVWSVRSVDATRALQFDDSFADEHGNINDSLPTSGTDVKIDSGASGGTRMVITTTFASTEAMEQVLAMGMEEGITSSVNQIDGLLT